MRTRTPEKKRSLLLLLLLLLLRLSKENCRRRLSLLLLFPPSSLPRQLARSRPLSLSFCLAGKVAQYFPPLSSFPLGAGNVGKEEEEEEEEDGEKLLSSLRAIQGERKRERGVEEEKGETQEEALEGLEKKP